MTEPLVSSGAVVMTVLQGELLMALAHEPEHRPNTYVIPKGRVESDETLAAAALREVREETGLTAIKLVTYLGSFERQSATKEGHAILKHIHLFLALAEGADDLINGGVWLPLPDAIGVLPFPEDRAFLTNCLTALAQPSL